MLKTPTTSPSNLASSAKPAASDSDALRAAFTGSAIGMSWQLALLVLVGILGGYKLDQLTGRSPLFTLIGLVLALVGSIAVIKRALGAINNFNVEPKNSKGSKA